MKKLKSIGQLITVTEDGIEYWGTVTKIEYREGDPMPLYHMKVKGEVLPRLEKSK